MPSLRDAFSSFFKAPSKYPYGSWEWYIATDRDPRWPAVDAWTFDHLHGSKADVLPTSKTLDAAFKHQCANGLPNISVSPAQGKFIQLQAKLCNAQRVLEVGTLGGYSTIFLAHASPTTHVTSLECDAKHAKVARENIQMAGLSERVEVVEASALEVMPKMVEEVRQGKREMFDFVFIDADKMNSLLYFSHAADMVRAGGLIIVDNVVRRGVIVDDKQINIINDAESVAKARELVEKVGQDLRVDCAVLQMVGQKNYDGMLFAVVGS